MDPGAQPPPCARQGRTAFAGYRISAAAWKKLAAFACAAFLLGCAAAPVSESPYTLGAAAFKAHDYKEAAAQWSIAANAGDPMAMNNLGFLLFSGQGVEQDQPRAIGLWQASATAGVTESQMYLGYAVENGIAVERDPALAYAWYRCAMHGSEKPAQGQWAPSEQNISQEAQIALTALVGKLSAADLQRGQALAAEYVEKYAAVPQAATPAGEPPGQ